MTLLTTLLILTLLLPSTAHSIMGQFQLTARGSGPEFDDGGSDTFIGLDDVPAAYTGAENKILKITETADGIEFIVATDAATASTLVKRDADGDFNGNDITAVRLFTSGTTAGTLQLNEAAASGSDAVIMKAPAAVTSTYTLVLPADPPTGAGQSLSCATPVAAVSTCTWATVDPAPVGTTEISQAAITAVTAPGPYQANPAYAWGYAFDANLTTMYHSVSLTHPTDFDMQLDGTYNLSGLRYDPREDNSNGRCTSYEIYLSTDGATWGSAVASGTLANNGAEKTITWTAASKSWVRFRCLADPSSIYFSAVEIILLQD